MVNFTAPMSKPDAEAAYYAKYPEAKKAKIRRAMTYKALNKLIQGSAADMTKKAMLDLYEEGIIPHIQIHDELDISVRDEQQAARIVEIMENAVTLAVPNKVDYESGNTWGDIYG
jgi:DNA polymerase I-like protein with 3'-5' exonuclease and polymerase domains